MTGDRLPAPYIAIDLIRSGEWDRYLLRLRAAVDDRLRTDKCRHEYVAGEMDPSGGDAA